MKKIKIYQTIFLFTLLFLGSCKSKEYVTINPEKDLSIVSGVPITVDFTSETGYELIQQIIEIHGYQIKEVEGIPKLPNINAFDKNGKFSLIDSDSIEIYVKILPGQDYSISTSIGPSFLCMLYDEDGIPISPLKNFQFMSTTDDKFMTTKICNIISKKDIRLENFFIDVEDFLYLSNTKLCHITYIEFDKKDNIVSSGKFLFPNFGNIGNTIKKQANQKAEKVYIKASCPGIFGLFIQQLTSQNFIEI